MTDIRKIVVHSHTGFCGMDEWRFLEVNAEDTNEDLDKLAYEIALNNAEAYGIYPSEQYAEMAAEAEEEDDINGDDYSDNIEGTWYDYVPELHDMHTIGGTPHFEQY